MKLNFQQITAHLNKTLLPIYLITGDELFLVESAKNAICQKAKENGFTEIQKYEASKENDWLHIVEIVSTPSLFSEKNCVIIKLTAKLSAATAKLFIQLIEKTLANLPRNEIIILTCDKLEASSLKTAWYQAIDNNGAIISVKAFDLSQFEQWLTEQLKKNNLQCEPAARQFLIDSTEGNLLACANELEKLTLLYPNTNISFTQMMTAISDNSRYNIFNYIDIILAGDRQQILHALYRLREEMIEPALILWGITRETRSLISMARDLSLMSFEQIAKQHRVWYTRQHLIKKMLQWHNLMSLHQILLHAGKIDHIIKGQASGDVWDEIALISLKLSGNAIKTNHESNLKP